MKERRRNGREGKDPQRTAPCLFHGPSPAVTVQQYYYYHHYYYYYSLDERSANAGLEGCFLFAFFLLSCVWFFLSLLLLLLF